MILKGKQIMEQYECETGLELDVEVRLVEVDEEEGSKGLFDVTGYKYEYVPEHTYRVDSIDGIATICYVYDIEREEDE